MNTKCYYAITYPDRTTKKIMLGNIGSSANVRGGLAENRFTRYMKNLYLCFMGGISGQAEIPVHLLKLRE